LGVVRGVFPLVVWLAVRAAVFGILAAVMAGVLISGQPAAAASSDPPPVRSVETAQTDDAPDPTSQTATGDGTLPFRVLTVAMASLAGILGVFTYWYWRATVPPARRGYLPSVVSPGAEAEHPAGPVGYLRAPPVGTPEDAGDLGSAAPGSSSAVPDSDPDCSVPTRDLDDAGSDLATGFPGVGGASPASDPDGAPPDLVIAPDFDEAVVDRADVGERTAPSAVGE